MSTSICGAQTSLEGIGLQNGDYAVGYMHYTVDDSSRTYKRTGDWNDKSIFRPMAVSVWYPGVIDPRARMANNTVLSYMRVLTKEEEWEHLPDEQILNWFYYPNTSRNRGHLKEAATAYKNLKPENDTFPVIIYSPSYQAASVENFALCEYLASHGYIVISSPSRGASSRPMEGGTVKDMETHARDAEFLIKEAMKNSNADKRGIALMGFSFGGLSNSLVKMRNGIIKAVVSLDGSERYQFQTLSKSSYFDPNKIDVPYMHLSQKEIPDDVLAAEKIDPTLNTEFALYDSLRYSSAYKLRFTNMTHAYFSTLGVLFQDRDTRQDKSDVEIMESYRLACLYTLNFLNAHLKGDIGGVTFISNEPERNGIRPGLILKESKEAASRPFKFEDFNNLAAERKYDGLDVLYLDLKKKHKDWQINEGNLNNLALQMLFNRETSQNSIKVLLFAVKQFPQSANLYDSLAEAYLFVGDKNLAVKNFKKSLSLDKSNENAIHRLKQLK
ncbi:hypothetical protein [Pedobacter faecalis]|uniref:hypothetical protein n=1 Tax=Pedobacter faecalis TaxID=3041495 RepID=UPI00254C8D22|nr:hypothetical protein [Pedobacter sp. ELA7]